VNGSAVGPEHAGDRLDRQISTEILRRQQLIADADPDDLYGVLDRGN